MKCLIPILALALLAVLPCCAQESLVVDDKIQDIAGQIEDAGGLDLACITLSRKASSKIEIDFRMNGAVPKTPKGDYMVIAYLSFGENASGFTSDINILACKVPGYANWTCKVDNKSYLHARESFQVVKFNQYKDGFSIAVSSPLFKDPVHIRGYAESISGGKVLDRAPAEEYFTWNESGQPTNSAPAQE